MNPLVFREYDIRGVADRDLTSDFVQTLGLALGTFLSRRGKRRIGLGRDCRLSSDRLHAALLEGLLLSGVHVVDVGVVPTPLLYFSVFHQELEGGVQITGSHNPPEDNGFKMMCGKDTLSGHEIRELRTMVERGDVDARGGGDRSTYDPLPAYTAFLRGNIKLARTDIRFAIDAGNGAGGPTALAAMHALGLTPEALYCEMDGRFPNHHPDPSQPENVEELIARVREQGLEVGLAYDGDADRLGVIDDKGQILWGDRLMILLSREMLRRHPGAAILGEVKCSQTLYDDIAQHGGRPVVWKTGHSLIKKKMREESALLAGELSGHLFFADRYFGFDDAVYAAARLIEILSRSDMTLDQHVDTLPHVFNTPEIRYELPDDLKFEVVARAVARFRKDFDVVDIDGARVTWPDGGGGCPGCRCGRRSLRPRCARADACRRRRSRAGGARSRTRCAWWRDT
jgi:phosphomannomutase/phosphoglucomutase